MVGCVSLGMGAYSSLHSGMHKCARVDRAGVALGPGEVSFAVRPVPDSHRQEGSFKRFQDDGSLMGLVTVQVAVSVSAAEILVLP